jgi:hypothetical protein
MPSLHPACFRRPFAPFLPINQPPQDIVARWKTTTFGGIGKPKTAALIFTHRAETDKNREKCPVRDGIAST